MQKLHLKRKQTIENQKQVKHELENRNSYLRDPLLAAWAQSKSIHACNIKIPSKLARRLEKLAGVVDFEKVYLNREVATMKEGTPFGDLALFSETDKRNASIRMKKDTVLAYLDRSNYNMVMKKVIKRNT